MSIALVCIALAAEIHCHLTTYPKELKTKAREAARQAIRSCWKSYMKSQQQMLTGEEYIWEPVYCYIACSIHVETITGRNNTGWGMVSHQAEVYEADQAFQIPWYHL